MTWIESHQSLRDHPKKDQLAELLWDPMTPADVADYATIGILHCLWYWAIDFAPDGDLARFTDRQLAKGCRYNGDGAHLRAALAASGFLDADGVLHDWHEYAGKLLQKRETDRERKAVRRKGGGSSADAPRKSRGRRPDGAGNRPTYLHTDLMDVDNSGSRETGLHRFDFKAAADALRRGDVTAILADVKSEGEEVTA